jgi:hypothetical protein
MRSYVMRDTFNGLRLIWNAYFCVRFRGPSPALLPNNLATDK